MKTEKNCSHNARNIYCDYFHNNSTQGVSIISIFDSKMIYKSTHIHTVDKKKNADIG